MMWLTSVFMGNMISIRNVGAINDIEIKVQNYKLEVRNLDILSNDILKFQPFVRTSLSLPPPQQNRENVQPFHLNQPLHSKPQLQPHFQHRRSFKSSKSSHFGLVEE